MAPAKRTAKDLRTQAGAAHAQQHHMREARVAHFASERFHFIDSLAAPLRDRQPTERIANDFLMGFL